MKREPLNHPAPSRPMGRATEEELRHDDDAASRAMTAEEQIERAIESKPKKWLVLAFRYLLPIVLTVLLVWYLFRKVDFANMMTILKEGVDYWWILLGMGISVISHISRAARWRLQLKALGISPPFMALCCSIFGCYALNLLFPRLGEVWRCTYIAKREKAPFTTVLGSMVSDRLTDTLSVVLITILAFIVATDAILTFLYKYPVGQGILALVSNPLFWGAVIVGICILAALFYYGRHTNAIRKLVQWIKELWLGFSTIWKMEGRWKFALFTIAIWGCYFMQLYVAFFAFDFTKELCKSSALGFGFVPCLVAFVLSAIGMAIPSNGGLGPWNIAIMFGLAIYGISDTEGTAFSMLQWSGQTVMLVILGIFTLIYIGTKKGRGSIS